MGKGTLSTALSCILPIAKAIAIPFSCAGAFAFSIVVAHFVRVARALCTLRAEVILWTASLCFFYAYIDIDIRMLILMAEPPFLYSLVEFFRQSVTLILSSFHLFAQILLDLCQSHFAL